VPEDVQLRLDAPDFVEQAGAAEAEVEVVALECQSLISPRP
jgi:hypothetical protein